MNKFLISGILALGLIGTAQASTALNTIDSNKACGAYEISEDWGGFCSCYAPFLNDNCNDCTDYGSFLCSFASDMVKGQSEYQDRTECHQQVKDETSNPKASCTVILSEGQCTQSLIDYNAHC